MKSDAELVKYYFGMEPDSYEMTGIINVRQENNTFSTEEIVVKMDDNKVVIEVCGYRCFTYYRETDNVIINYKNLCRFNTWYLENSMTQIVQRESGLNMNMGHYYGKFRLWLTEQRGWNTIRGFMNKDDTKLKHFIINEPTPDELIFNIDGTAISGLTKYNAKGQVKTKW